MPLVELFEEVRIDLEEVQRRRVRDAGRLHEAQQQEKVVQLFKSLNLTLEPQSLQGKNYYRVVPPPEVLLPN